jgi:hypothetical protein
MDIASMGLSGFTNDISGLNRLYQVASDCNKYIIVFLENNHYASAKMG